MLDADRTDFGRLFQAIGPAVANACWPKLMRVLGTIRSPIHLMINHEMDVCFPNGVILVLKIILPLIKFLIFNFSFHSIFILKIILVSIFILFTRFNLIFYSILFLKIILSFHSYSILEN